MLDVPHLDPALRAEYLQAPRLGGGHDGAQVAGRAAAEAEEHRGGVVGAVVLRKAQALRGDGVDGTGEIEHRVHDVYAATGHTAGGRLVGVVAPVFAREAVDARAAEIAFEVQELPQPPVGQHRLHLAQRRLEAPVVADGERHLASGARRDRSPGLLERQAERLLDEHVLAGLRRGDDLLAVPRVRGGQYDGVDVVFQQFFVASEKRNAVPPAEFFSPGGRARRAGDEANGVAALHRAHEVLPPVADADDRRAKHACMIPSLAEAGGRRSHSAAQPFAFRMLTNTKCETASQALWMAMKRRRSAAPPTPNRASPV